MRISITGRNGSSRFGASARDAIKFALSANARHGLHRSNEDKRKAVEFALADEEWGKLSSRAIAELCGVSPQFVCTLRESTVNGGQLTDVRVGRDGRARKTPAAPKSAVEEDMTHDSEDESPFSCGTVISIVAGVS